MRRRFPHPVRPRRRLCARAEPCFFGSATKRSAHCPARRRSGSVSGQRHLDAAHSCDLLVSSDGVVIARFVDPDYRRRMEVEDLLETLRADAGVARSGPVGVSPKPAASSRACPRSASADVPRRRKRQTRAPGSRPTRSQDGVRCPAGPRSRHKRDAHVGRRRPTTSTSLLASWRCKSASPCSLRRASTS